MTNYPASPSDCNLSAIETLRGAFHVPVGWSDHTAGIDVPLAADATGLVVEGGELIITRPVYAGRAFAKVVITASPRLVSIRPNTFRPQESAAAGLDRAAIGHVERQHVCARQWRRPSHGGDDVPAVIEKVERRFAAVPR